MSSLSRILRIVAIAIDTLELHTKSMDPCSIDFSPTPKSRAYRYQRRGHSLHLSFMQNVRRTLSPTPVSDMSRSSTLISAPGRHSCALMVYDPAPPPSDAEDNCPDANPRVLVSTEGRERRFVWNPASNLSRPLSAHKIAAANSQLSALYIHKCPHPVAAGRRSRPRHE